MLCWINSSQIGDVPRSYRRKRKESTRKIFPKACTHTQARRRTCCHRFASCATALQFGSSKAVGLAWAWSGGVRPDTAGARPETYGCARKFARCAWKQANKNRSCDSARAFSFFAYISPGAKGIFSFSSLFHTCVYIFIMAAKQQTLPTFTVGDYASFALAGAMGCGVTHGAMTPIDVVKTRIQLEPTVYNKGMIGSFKQVVSSEGAGALLTGLGPTVLGYSLQGAFKFGGYELFKKTFIEQLGYDTASKYKNSVYIGSAALAEFFADIALCPLEATRIRLVSQPTFANGLIGGFSRILKEEGVGSFYNGFTPILFKQIPYNIAKFLVFERAAEAIYGAIPTPKAELSSGAATAVNLGAGIIAGCAAAIVSQPADTLLSKVNKTKKAPGQSTIGLLGQLAKQLGIRGSFAGLPTRLVMVGTLTSLQFTIYGSLKSALNCPKAVEL
ncbi:putative mitochondrial phosphate carrier [Clavispora lusitaniae]|uniref:Mitochondrial phosphate carrier n=1 Tax=Clavispora lusitaniae TaxID=36911 RepID=A0ACD0WDZ5_CLALS|nr:putative mitochondrial phosphate carrier [Clavispora lusitaniae]QFZ31217.1 putative mitochondrial phosphate carrier [Clavispora lusitaniae]QFZ36885.1 putative mitochondrial phosphate carrier [Clavispora lusitaniae]QFZ42569.1 putative mitochondrial phosphate carrier [Clavispora lusitaniae]QFZ48245.1 putative mitochondrial phosphate carrier [Clavispora lusitaniae]